MKPVLISPRLSLSPLARSLTMLGALLLLASTAHASEQPDPLKGKMLFEKSNCLDCHGSEVFTRDDRKVTDYGALEKQVRRCDANLSTNWFDDQVLDVVEYLNTTYYQFEKPKPKPNSSSSVPPLFEHANTPADAEAVAVVAESNSN